MATIDVADCCLVCADPLEWTGIGVCGHKEICSRCVARMRFVLKDNNCVLCKQESPAVFFTRFMGDYTARVAPEDYPDKLQERASRGELYHCAAVDGYFDDPKHHAEISALCGWTHPVLDSNTQGKPPPRFNSMADMKKYIDANFKLMFCDICVRARKVFVCEQLLYTKAQLDRHNREGDETGPLAQSSFKGHPLCRFCRQRFYDSQELWRHMESSHENCFLCRRAAPDKYVYYRHYKELEDHFRGDHYLCPHPRCLEKKFVVFDSDQELKRHFATEHGDELKMSRAQRREASAVAIPIQYREPGDNHHNQASASGSNLALLDRPGVVIGGGHNVGSRHGPRVGASAMHHSRSEPQIQNALQASFETAQAEAAGRPDADADVSSITFSAADFPTVGAAYGAGPSMRPVGLWAGGPSAGAGPSSSSSGGQLNSADFPALPNTSKSAKKRAKDQSLSLAQRLAASSAAPRVMNRAVVPSGVPGAAFPPLGGNSSSFGGGSVGFSAAAFPQLGSGTSAAAPAPLPSSLPAAPRMAPTPPSPVLAPSYTETPMTVEPPSPPSLDNWPGLVSSSSSTASRQPPGSSGAASSSQSSAAARFFAMAQGGPPTASTAAAPASALLQQRAPTPPTLDDFPALPIVPKPSKAKKGAKTTANVGSAAKAGASTSAGMSKPASGQAQGIGAGVEAEVPSYDAASAAAASAAAAAAFKAATERAASARTAATAGDGARGVAAAPPSAADFPSLAQVAVAINAGAGFTARPSTASASMSSATSGSSAAAATTVATGGVSESVKAANRALVDKIKAQLSDDKKFDAFRRDSGDFQKGNIAAPAYHDRMLNLGLLALVPEVASLCPDPEKQSQLMAAHMAFLASPAANDVQRLAGGWVPPEAALAAARQAEANKCWACPTCTLINAPTSGACEACGFRSAAHEFPALGASSASGPSSSRVNGSASKGQTEEGQSVKGKSGGKGVKSKGTVLNIGMVRQGTGRKQPAPEPAPPPPSVWGQQDKAALKQQVEAQRQLLAQNRNAQNAAWTPAAV